MQTIHLLHPEQRSGTVVRLSLQVVRSGIISQQEALFTAPVRFLSKKVQMRLRMSRKLLRTIQTQRKVQS